jgi:hypothetical protein
LAGLQWLASSPANGTELGPCHLAYLLKADSNTSQAVVIWAVPMGVVFIDLERRGGAAIRAYVGTSDLHGYGVNTEYVVTLLTTKM